MHPIHDYAEAHLEIAEAMVEQCRFEDAMPILKTLHGLNLENIDNDFILRHLASCEIGLRMFDDAFSHYSLLSEKYPRDRDFLIKLSEICDARGDHDTALEYVRKGKAVSYCIVQCYKSNINFCIQPTNCTELSECQQVTKPVLLNINLMELIRHRLSTIQSLVEAKKIY